MSEDDEKIILKTDAGAFVNFKKEDVDLEKTAAANPGKAAPAPARRDPEPQKTTTSKVRTYTNEDIQPRDDQSEEAETPVAEAPATQTAATQTAVGETPATTDTPAEQKPAVTRTPEEWQAEILARYNSLAEAKTKYVDLRGKCLGQKVGCKEADEAQVEVEKLQTEYDALIKEATDAGVDSDILHPEREAE
jgi:hypothetical protein